MKEIYRKMEDGTWAQLSGKVAFIDSLTSESTTDGLAANQGKVLNESKQDKSSLEADVQAKGFTKNVGTITGIKMNDTTVGTSGVVDLGKVIVNCPFPVGGIFISVGSANPSTYWSGTSWSKLSDGTFLMADSTGQKAAVNAELPNVVGALAYYYGTTEQKQGCFKRSAADKVWLMTQKTSESDFNNMAVFDASDGQTKADGTYVDKANSVFKNGGKVIPTGTIKVVMWERIA